MSHPKEVEILEWLGTVTNPSPKDIYQQFAPDLEAIVIGHILAGLDLDDGLSSFCKGIDLSDRIDRYSAFPFWFKIFVQQDLYHAVKILNHNDDQDHLGKDIVIETKTNQEHEYVNLAKNTGSFPNNEIHLTFQNVILVDDKNEDGTFEEDNIDNEFRNRILNNSQITFKDEYLQKLFYFLELQDQTEVSMESLQELGYYSDKASNTFVCKTIEAIAKITDQDVLIYISGNIAAMFKQNPTMSYDREKIIKDAKKALGKYATEYAEDQVKESLSDLAVLVGGRSAVMAKIAYKLVSHGIKAKNLYDDVLDENINITYTEEDEKDFFSRFFEAYQTQKQSIKAFFTSDVKIPLQKVYIQNRLDFSQLSDAFFDTQYRTFIQERYYSRMSDLPVHMQKQIMAIENSEDRETKLFIALSKNDGVVSNLMPMY